ncbi:hypothetical protein M406DRAFT_321525 [Cryphonectria parasitica EP155]|uniref:Uncharacterized protein n=1 Tax=Cryphonectria parasitica (strain ATCC 38755 / EP155) TaxID=660469 RepID=A0A9P5CQA0_CRYP1|nr:uncharacterized protein M406DRAFT_321525 [Cryphonectria parasitica EP155]KAF3767299.1 hypothetical protein M406DRAFT_321525 [Cryphonectria parasitica EP155]
MAFGLRNVLSSSKSSSKKEAPRSYTKLQESSSSILSADGADLEAAKRKAYEAKRAKDAEEYLYKYGFGGGVTTNSRV